MDVFDALSRARARGEPVVLVTVLAVEGDAPTRSGAKLVVGPEGIVAGTLGCSEFDTAGVELAGEAIGQERPLRRRLDFPSHSRERAIELFAEPQRPEPAVLVIGANPVARSVAELAPADGRVTAGGVEVHADDPERFLLAAPPGATDAVVVSDHDASWVDAVLRVALASDAFFVGMLGSRRHAPEVIRRMRDGGVPPANLARLRCPCGLDIGSRTPAEIGLSIVAEIVATARGRDGRPLGLDWSAGASG
jgi:xanthine dehydrogenase accessory factor